MVMTVTATWFGEDYWTAPHDAAARLARPGCAVERVMIPGFAPAWLIGGYRNVSQALVDPRLGKDSAVVKRTIHAERARAGLPVLPWLSRLFDPHPLFLDGHAHERQRRLLAASFTTRRVQQLQPRIEQIAAGVLDDLAEQAGGGEVDLVAGYAAVVPLTIICELLGIPEVDRAAFREITVALMDDDPDRTLPASRTMEDFFDGLIAAKRRRPGGDLTSSLVHTAGVSREQLVGWLFLLFIAGHETSVGLIGNTALALLEQTGLWRRVAEDSDLVAPVVEEVLRHNGPIQHATHRVTLQPVTYDGVTIPAGELVLLSLASANRDPARWSNPELFDPQRDTRGHLAFGLGMHRCLGATLGRLEARIAIPGLTRRFPDAELAVPPTRLRRLRSVIVNGLTALPVRLRPV